MEVGEGVLLGVVYMESRMCGLQLMPTLSNVVCNESRCQLMPLQRIVPSLIVSFALHYLREHINTFASFFTEDEDINAYLTAMALPGTWGDSLVLTAAAVLLQAPIHVAQSLVYI